MQVANRSAPRGRSAQRHAAARHESFIEARALTRREAVMRSLLRALALLFAFGCAAPRVVTPRVVDGDTAHRLVAEGIRVVDVRTPAEFNTGHVPGAVNIPYDQMAQRHAELGPPSTPVLVYCRSGHRSGLAIAVLREKGFTDIYDLKTYDRWVAAEKTPR
jgi:phage shock protein E